MERFELSDAQAQAIVDMRLRTLTGLEREKLEAEYKELMARIRRLKAILADRNTAASRDTRGDPCISVKNMVMTEGQPSDLTSSIFPWRI